MPTYSYRCTECTEAFDIVQSFSDEALTECPACGKRLRKVFSAVGVAFKGSGFYRTDSASSSARSTETRGSSSENSSSASVTPASSGAGTAA